MTKFILGVVCLVALNLAISAKPVYKRISFKKGASKTVATGTLSGYKGQVYYVIRLRAGQRLRITSDRNITLAEVANPKGKDVVDRVANCNGTADISPTVAGDYKITVVECTKADRWKGNFKLFISVK